MWPIIFRCSISQRIERNAAHHVAVEGHGQIAAVDDFADHREIQFPLLEDRLCERLAARLQHHQHPLLGFRQHHFIGRHGRLATRHLVQIKPDADAALRRHFHRRTGQARRAHVLNGHDRIRCHQFQAGFDQQFFGERVAHLHGRAFFFAVLVKFGAGHGGTVDAVASGLGTDIDHRITDAGSGRIKNLVCLGDAHGHRIDDDIAVVAGVENRFPAHGRHANAIAVTADAGDDALHQVTHLGRVDVAKAQRIHVGDGARAHGEHVAQDAAHAGGCALIGLDIAWVVVALHLEDGSVAVTNVDYAGILARAADHPRRLCGQLGQVHAAGFVAAMFRPHYREDTEFEQVRLPPHGREHALIFFGREAVGGNNLGRDLAHGARIACGGSFVMSQREALLHFPLRPGGQWQRIAA